MVVKKSCRISDVPTEVLEKEMKEYGAKKARTKKSARSFLRSVGMKIRPDGTLILPPSIG